MSSLDLLGPLFSMLVYAFIAAVGIYITVSILLFIFDAVKAKKQDRKIKTGIKIMFIIAMVLTAIMLALGIYVIVLLIYLSTHGPF